MTGMNGIALKILTAVVTLPRALGNLVTLDFEDLPAGTTWALGINGPQWTNQYAASRGITASLLNYPSQGPQIVEFSTMVIGLPPGDTMALSGRNKIFAPCTLHMFFLQLLCGHGVQV